MRFKVLSLLAAALFVTACATEPQDSGATSGEGSSTSGAKKSWDGVFATEIDGHGQAERLDAGFGRGSRGQCWRSRIFRFRQIQRTA